MISEKHRRELVTLLSGTAHVLSGSALDYEAIARRAARLSLALPPRLRRCAEEANSIARTVGTIALHVETSGPRRNGSAQ
jgi:hypothetical protein